MTIDFICKQLAKDFEIPCNFSPMDEIMLEDDRCEKDCGEIPESECWKRYFEVMQKKSRAMTREEAARIITVILDCCKGKDEDYEKHEIIPLEKSFKALSMAIEALEQEPTAQPFTEEQIQTMQKLESAQIEKAYELGMIDRPTAHWKDGKWCSNCGEGIPTDVYGGGVEKDEIKFCFSCGARIEG